MDDFQLPDEMRDELQAAWHRYLDRVQPFRPLLHAYCRKLTGQLWDAEDLSQETLMRGFQTLARTANPIENPRAYLLRIATHTWIDQLRRRETEKRLAPAPAEASGDPSPAPGAARDAGQILLQRLAPRERAAVLLKELFEMTLEEIAVVLGSTAGAVKAALHRGRERLEEPEDGPSALRPLPSIAVVDRFVELLNAKDRDGMLELLLDNAGVTNLGVGHQFGEGPLRSKRSWVEGAFGGHPEWPEIFRFESERAARVDFEGEPIVLLFRTRERWGGEALEAIYRLQEEDGHVSQLLSYGFCPETVRAVGEALSLKVRTGIYRPPDPEPGAQDDPA